MPRSICLTVTGVRTALDLGWGGLDGRALRCFGGGLESCCVSGALPTRVPSFQNGVGLCACVFLTLDGVKGCVGVGAVDYLGMDLSCVSQTEKVRGVLEGRRKWLLS